ncbi:maleylacetate reductase [Falsiroseomonas selenitidurans]|uniref:Maleylacetate reductase n=1 Tax=Falsiroseomonas selenitidurans TaxID=2716335 RepID=A0ABX1E3H7_9PROT|nr:maleylacetate reductase [Falsiroseomonas selenitidurans]NKC31730.1 maleylacetate reductase [Falsiroseomonas selenitidurans]
MQRFTYEAAPMRVVFGDGTLAALGAEVERLGLRRAVLVVTPSQAARGAALAAQLGPLAAGVIPLAAMHTPVEVTEQALALLRAMGGDGLVAVGGGSAIGLSKALALRSGLKQIAVPTTYAGSEMTPILGQTEAGRKLALRSAAVLPQVVIYDVALTLGLPPALSATSGLNAMAHAVEALYAPDANPVTSLMAEEAIRALAAALPAVVAEPGDRAARAEALQGAWLAGACLGAVTVSLHHKLCHVLGGSFGLPHAETHAAVLPWAVQFNAPAAPAAMARIARALGQADAVEGLFALSRRLGAPASLAALGLAESDLDRAAEIATAAPYPNPRPVERAAIRALLGAALRGR